jgi:D-alanyl-D-alanine carboxypeptidase
MRVPILLLAAVACRAVLLACPATAQEAATAQAPRLMDALVKAYPDFLAGHEANAIVWRDGTRMAFDDGKGARPFEAMLDPPDLKDMFYAAYPLGRQGLPPAVDSDPGRVRFGPLFDKMYGDCAKGEVAPQLVDVVWLPSHGAQRLKATRVNGVAERLQAVSDELDRLPGRLIEYVAPSAGTYNCRVVAGTGRTSPHGHGIAIDIATAHSDYWRWARRAGGGRYPYRNRIPWEIVEVFERHGFIWGGKWYHFDTMHFEYRPEIIAASRQ